MNFSLLLRCSGVTGLILFMGVGCKRSGAESSDTQGGGLSVGRMEFRDPRALQARQTSHTGVSSGPAAVKGQVPGGRQAMNSSSGIKSSPASGSLSATEYAQSLNQYAKAMSSGRVHGSVFNQGQPVYLTGSSFLDMDKSQVLTRWSGMGRDAVQLEVNKLKAEQRENTATARWATGAVEVFAGPSVHGDTRMIMRESIQQLVMEKLTDFVKAYNESHPNQPQVFY